MAIDEHLGHSQPEPHQDYDRTWNLAALRGENSSDAAYATIRAARALAEDGHLDPEALSALNTGDLLNPDDTRRHEPLDRTWDIDIDEDPELAARLEELVASNGSHDDYLPAWAHLIVDGKTWLTSGPDTAQPLWGTSDAVIAALDQPTTIAGPQGAGKSVFGQRLALGWIGVINQILGFPVHHGDGNVLYLASDRPDQARLSMRRMVTDDHLDTLEARMRVWKGPPPEDVAKQPLMLLDMAEASQSRCLIIDSVKDIAIKLSADEIGAAYNSALQHCVASGIQIIALHHPRKLGGDTRGEVPVRTLDDLYGASWITAGNGSVLYLQPGELDGYVLSQLKTPIGHKIEISYEHVIETGDVRQSTAPTLDSILAEAGLEGVSSTHAAKCLYRTADPDGAQRKRVWRALNEMAEEGSAETFTGPDKRKQWRTTK
jgi:replicative DNA helicase